MTTYHPTSIQGGTRMSITPLILFMLTACVLVGGGYFCYQNRARFTRHSKVSHPDAVSSIEKCFNGGGTLSPTFKLDNGRWGQYCSDGSGNNYWRIVECEAGGPVVVTQFKQAIKKLKNYIRNHGMVPDPVPC